MARLQTAEHYIFNSSESTNWKPKPIINSFAVDTVLDAEAFSKLPILIVKSGAIGLQHMLGDGRQTISVIYFEGEVLDFRHFGKTSGRATCILPVTAELFSGEDFDKMQFENTQFQIEQATKRAHQLTYASQHSVDLARKSAIEKLASFILESRKRQDLGRCLDVLLRLRRADIADYMGLRAETLSRAFTKLKKLGLIACDQADLVHITNEPGLRQLANGKVNWMKTRIQ